MLKIILSIFLLITVSYGSNPLLVKAPINYKIGYDKNSTCLVRHFKVYKEPKWVSSIILKNKKEVFFSSPKSMFEFYFRPGKWYDVGVKSENDFHLILITDYNTLQPENAKDAYYVFGSRAISPAGDDLAAFKDKISAENFSKKYGGKRVLSFYEVSDAFIRLLNGRI